MNYNELCLYLGVPTLFALLALPLRPQRPHAAFYLGLTRDRGAAADRDDSLLPALRPLPGHGQDEPDAADLPVRLRRVHGRGARSRRARRPVPAAPGRLLGARARAARRRGGPGRRGGGESLVDALVQRRVLRRRQQPGRARHDSCVCAPGRPRWCSNRCCSPPQPPRSLVAYAWWRARAARWATLALLVALLGYDLGSFGWGYNAIVEPRQVYPRTPAIDFLARQPGPFRVVLDGRQRFLINSLAPFGIQKVGGYSSFYPEAAGRYLSFMRYGEDSLRGARFDRWVIFEPPAFPAARPGERQVSAHRAPGGRERPDYRLVFREDLAIYENTAALPRAFAVHRARVVPDADAGAAPSRLRRFRPRQGRLSSSGRPTRLFSPGCARGRGATAWTSSATNRTASRCSRELGASGWLVLSDAWDPGWRAEVDGRPAAIERADVCFRAVALGPGRHRVVFTYVARAVRLGLLLTLCRAGARRRRGRLGVARRRA